MNREKQSPVVYALIGAIAVLLVVVVVLVVYRLRAPEETVAAPTTTAVVTSTSAPTTEALTSTTAVALPSTEEKCGVLARNAVSGMTKPQQQYCDGKWLWAGQEQSDHLNLYHWTDRWERYIPDGKDNFAGYDCYEQNRLEVAGAPATLVEKLNICTSDAPPTSQANAAEDKSAWAGPGVACDGRWILIVESVLVGPGDAAPLVVGDAIDRWPGSSSTPGSACSSMRATYEGKKVYAIYYDAGHSVSEVCALKAKYGGNARSMNNVGDFSDPC